VTAVEKDPRLCGFLRRQFGEESRLDLICADALRLDLGPETRPDAKEAADGGAGARAAGMKRPRARDVDAVVSNLPYSAGSRILAKIAMLESPPRSVTVTVQREVGERMAAGPGSPAYGLLGVWMQSVYEVKRVRTVGRGCFWPAPEVESAIVRLRLRTPLPGSPEERGVFFDLTKRVFAHRRKQMGAILNRLGPRLLFRGTAARDLLERGGIPPAARPEDLSVGAFLSLARAVRGEERPERIDTGEGWM
jgi:16S rRNA (adenine1518-N6/adenine1519-N6)-dimethyltransferase